MQNTENFKKLAKSFEVKFEVDSISAKKLRLAQKQKSPLLIFDVRHKNEQSISMIPGAIPITASEDPTIRKDFQAFIQKHKGNKKARIVFYCAVGYRSSQMVNQVKDTLNLKNSMVHQIPIKNLFGGIFLWATHKYALVKPATKEKTFTIHGYNSWWSGFLNKDIKFVILPPVKD